MVPKPTANILKQLRSLMQNLKHVPEPLTAYIVPTSDAHSSEYLADCDQFRTYISGFSGSAGTALITEKEARLWTDARYFLQAGEQLDSNWILMKEGLPETLSLGDWITKNLPKGSTVGVDPKLYTYCKYNPLHLQLEASGQKLLPVTENLVELIWTDRPPRSANIITPLPLQFTGKTIKDKLDAVNDKMKERKARHLVLAALDEVAWFLNLRGSDIEYNPLFFAYVIIAQNEFTIFMNPQQNSTVIREHLASEAGNTFKIEPYDTIEDRVKELTNNLEDDRIWFSEDTSFSLLRLMPKKNCLLTEATPVEVMKAVKNPVEIAGMKNAHIKDAAALCCYFSWLEKNVKTLVITEISGAEKLLEFRKMQKDFVGPSFPTISSVGPHGAIIHYLPDKESDIRITADQIYLCDSGGQYKDGTTDVTRTWHFGEPTKFEKECYTRVLKGQLKLGNSIFPSKIKGNCLDSFAREYLWEVGLDYSHGTGHGIGSYLNVHEGPMGISWRPLASDPGLEAGMFISNEPGYYQDGEFGIRIEDIVQVIEANPPNNFNSRGYLTFETVTLVPKSTKFVVKELLTDAEIRLLNKYHKVCRDVVGPLLEQQGQLEAKEWLYRESEAISR